MITYATVCSGIEAPSRAWEYLGWRPLWFSEIDKHACKVLAHRYPTVPNLGDLLGVKALQAPVPDVLIGGTPCQAFSPSGFQKSLEDDRGALTFAFLELALDTLHRNPQATVIWENVPGVLNTKDNAFGQFITTLSHGLGTISPLPPDKGWPTAGAVDGPVATVGWRTLDAQHFGVPQRRRRVYVVASLIPGRVEQVLFERTRSAGQVEARKEGGGNTPENGSDCARAIWCLNGTQYPITALNKTHPVQAAGGGTTHFFIEEHTDSRLAYSARRMTPEECERLQGFPAGWTSIIKSETMRYRLVGNSMAVPVLRWLGKRLEDDNKRLTGTK
jgi:DNA (cytosine-5)-methyltransferase 1